MMKRLLQHFYSLRYVPLKNWIGVSVAAVLIASPKMAEAISIWDVATGHSISSVLLYIFNAFTYFVFVYLFGILSTQAMKLLIFAAGASGFTNRPVIIEAWTVVRDLSNMFFIVILLVIAFGTLFRIEAYSWKKLLPKMVVVAILVNYSRAIVGLAVDASQVIMLTFVEAIRPVAVAGFVDAFQFSSLLSRGDFRTDPGDIEGLLELEQNEASRTLTILVASAVLATVFLVVAVYLVIILGRVVFIWFLTILSPLAFASMVLPVTEKYFKQWSEMLSRYITIGPILMFFLWLSLFISAKAGGNLSSILTDADSSDLGTSSGVAVTAALSDGTVLIGFGMSILMMLAGVKIAQSASSEMGSVVSKAAGVGTAIAKAPYKAAYGSAKAGYGYAARKVHKTTGLDLMRPQNIAQKWRAGMAANAEQDKLAGDKKARENFKKGSIMSGVLGAGDAMAQKGLSSDQLRGLGLGKLRPSKEKRFQDTFKKDKALNEKELELNEKIAEAEKEEAGKSITFEEKAKRDAAHAAEQARIAEAKEYGKEGMVDAGDYSGIVQSLKEDLLQKRKDASSPEEYSKLTSQIAKVDAALSSGGTLDMDADMKKVFNASIGSQEKALKKRRESGDLQTKDMDAVSDDTYQALIANAGAEEKARKAEIEKERKLNAEARRELAPVMPLGAEDNTHRSQMNRMKGGIQSGDSDQLLDESISAIESGRALDALAYIEKSFDTGNINDILDHYGHEFSHKGMMALEKTLKEKLGAGNADMILESMRHGTQVAEQNNQWPIAQAYKTQGGRIIARTYEEHKANVTGEMLKRSGTDLSKSRLVFGEFGQSVPENEFMVETAGRVMAKDTRTDGLIRPIHENQWKYLKEEPAMMRAWLRGAKSAKIDKTVLKRSFAKYGVTFDEAMYDSL